MLLQGARKLGGRQGRSTAFMSFYAVAMCEVVATVQVSRGIVQHNRNKNKKGAQCWNGQLALFLLYNCDISTSVLC